MNHFHKRKQGITHRSKNPDRFSSTISSYPVLFKDVDEFIDPIILEMAEKMFEKDSTVKFGEKSIEIDVHFRLYLTCRFSNPKLSSMHFSRLKVIDFSVSREGLEDQLLSKLIEIERAELEEKRETLIKDLFETQREQIELENLLLRELATSTGFASLK